MGVAARSKRKWYRDGVRFTCIPGCRRCCGGFPGDVWVTADEIKAIARYLGLNLERFETEYLRRYAGGRISLKECSNYDCVFLGDHGCSVYPVRPKQCRDYPFWPEIVSSKRAWSEEMNHCPGIGEGDLHTPREITEILDSQKDS